MSASDGLIAGYSLTESREGWEQIFAAFRGLGGVADNIRLGRGQFGRGLFPIEPDKPIRLYVPENLIFPVEHIGFADDLIKVDESTGTPKPERDFFERYANVLSWGGGGRQEVLALLAAFDALPNEIQALLATDFGMSEWLEGERATRAQLQFLQSRVYEKGGRDVLIPMFELANHDRRGFRWKDEDGGVGIAGNASGEILMSYGQHDPLSMFHRFAIVSREPVAFSLPMTVQIGPIPLSIGRSFEVVQRGDTLLPRMMDSGGGLALAFLTLGHPNFPRLPRGTFRALMKPLGASNPDEEFDRIAHANWTKFLELLGVLETHEGDMIVSLRKMAQYQLEAMSFCIGAREL